jgi:hypothetical protein
VTVLAGATTAIFTVVTNSVTVKTTVQVSATLNGSSKTGTLTVTANTPTSVTFTPGSVIGGASSTGKVVFGRVLASDTVVTLSIVTGGSAVASMPSSITILAGNSSGTWTVVTNAVTSTTSVQISATANGGSKTGTLTVTPNTPTSVTFTPGSVTGGASSTGKVFFGRALASDTTVTITVNSGSEAIASVPANFTVLAGGTSGTFTVITAPVTQTTAAQFTVAANTGTKTATLTVQ